MPFAFGPYFFTEAVINGMRESCGVYGLATPTLLNPNAYLILYVGKTGNLRERLKQHYCNPPVAGVTHFFAEAHPNDMACTQREFALVKEFKPVGNTQLR